MGSGTEPRPPASDILYIQIKSELIFASFGIYIVHHYVRFPHHSQENSRTFQGLALKFSGPNPFISGHYKA